MAIADPFLPPPADLEPKAKVQALSSRLDDLYRSKMTEIGATAGAVGIVVGGELVYGRAFGVRYVKSQAPVDTDTVFRLGSVSKGIAALAVMKLREEGKIALDAPAANVLPELRSIADPTRDAPSMTARHSTRTSDTRSSVGWWRRRPVVLFANTSRARSSGR